MKEIPLTQGKVALIDDDDYEQVSKYKWFTLYQYTNWYASRKLRINGKKASQSLHRFLLNAQPGQFVDHRDGNGLNCQRYNIRICTHADNAKNARRYKSNTSGYKGVSLRIPYGYWRAYINVNGKRICLGNFVNVIDAAYAYDIAARKYHGEFAKTNF